MTKEQKKYVEFYKKFIQSEEQELEFMYKEDEEYYKDDIEQKELLIKGWKAILNLIQEQEKEINKYLEIIANKVIETAKDDLLTEKNIEIEKKDKIIDELAKAFKQDDVRSVEEIKQYFERKIEEEEKNDE